MSLIAMQGGATGTGTVTLLAPITNTNQTLTLPDATGTVVSTASTAVVSQAMLATNVAGNGAAFSAHQSGTPQSIPNSTATKVQFQSEEFDTNSNFDSTTNYRFTPTVAGYYQVNTQISFNSFVTTELVVQIFKNGSAVKRGNRFNAINSPYLLVTALIYLNGSSDYLEIYAYQASSGAQTLEDLGSRGNYFQAFLARAA
jgi:hypothetical protein